MDVVFFLLGFVVMAAMQTPIIKCMARFCGGGALSWMAAALIITIGTALNLIPYVGWIPAAIVTYYLLRYLLRNWGDTDSSGGTILTILVTNGDELVGVHDAAPSIVRIDRDCHSE